LAVHSRCFSLSGPFISGFFALPMRDGDGCVVLVRGHWYALRLTDSAPAWLMEEDEPDRFPYNPTHLTSGLTA
jgi:hypothetical protein